MSAKVKANELQKENGLEMTFQTTLGVANDQTIDKWELMASRRALMNLRTLLQGEAMDKLIQQQVEESDERIKEILSRSNGEFKEVRVEATVKGITASEFLEWQGIEMKKCAVGTPEERKEAALKSVYPAHPEHYSIPQFLGNVETLGGMPTRVRVVKLNEVPAFVTAVANKNFTTLSKASAGELADGTVWGYGLMEYQDTDYGCDMIYHVWWPAAAPQIFFDDHARHFAVEHRNFIQMAYESVQSKN